MVVIEFALNFALDSGSAAGRQRAGGERSSSVGHCESTSTVFSSQESDFFERNRIFGGIWSLLARDQRVSTGLAGFSEFELVLPGFVGLLSLTAFIGFQLLLMSFKGSLPGFTRFYRV